jgi:hypothetical protein
MASDRRAGLLDLLVAVLLGVGAFVLYVLTLAPTVLAGDGGEFQFVPYLLGVAHPTGYPLYVLLGWAWSRLLPVDDVAYRLNLFSALAAAAAVGLVYPTTRSLLRQTLPYLIPLANRLVAVLAAAILAATPTLWSQAIMAEVYGLHLLLVVLLFCTLLAWGEQRTAPGSNLEDGRQQRLLLGAALSFGLGLAHHRTTLLLVPAVLVYVWLVDRRTFSNWRLLLKALLLVLLPLLLYLLIPLRAPHTPYLRLPLTPDRELVLYENTLPGFVEFVLGGPFGGSVDLSVELGQRLVMAWGFFHNEVGWIGLLLALAGIVLLVLAGAPRHALLALTGLAFLALGAFNLVYTIGDIFVMYIPAYFVVVLWLAVGAGALAWSLAKLLSRFAGRNRSGEVAEAQAGGAAIWAFPVIAVLLLFLLPVSMVVANHGRVNQSGNTRARARWEAILAEPLPTGAILVSDDRNDIMPMWYFQYVEGQRTDLVGLYPLVTADYPTLGEVLDLAQSTERPVYLIKEMPGVEVKVAVEPEGGLWRVLGPAAEAPPALGQGEALAGAVLLAGHDRSPHSPGPGEELQVRLYWEPLRPLGAEYHTFVHLLDPEGQKVAQSDRQPGGDYYPSNLWRPGERLRDEHRLSIPAGAQPGVYRLLAGMYALSGEGALEPLGEPVLVGQVAIKTGAQTEPEPVGQPVGANFGDQIELLSYDLASPDAPLAVTLQWRALRPPAADYTVFVHLLDAGGATVAQHDARPQGGAYPTSVWDGGEVVVDEHTLALPPDLPPGDYWLRVGLYLLETGERLPVTGNGDSIQLGPIQLGD